MESFLDRYARFALAIYWPALAAATHWPRLDLANPTIGPVGLDKLVHSGSFGLLALLLIYARIVGRAASRRIGLIAGVAVAAAYAVADEWTQGLTQRTVSVQDLAADFLGVGVVGVVIWLIQADRAEPARSEARGDRDAADRSRSTASVTGPSEDPGGFVGHAVMVSALTILSRVLGLVRDAVLAACFGMTAITDAFWIGFIVPNLFRRLFGEGALTAAFIPVYCQLLGRDRLMARRLAWLCVGFMLVVLGGVTLVGEMMLALLLQTGQWSEDGHLAMRLAMIMLPYMPLICVTALLGGLLQVHGRFGPPAAAPVLLNAVMIVAALAVAGGATGQANPRWAITVVAASVVIAGVLQLIWQGSAAIRCQAFTADVAPAMGALRSVLTLMLPMVFALAVFQVNTLLDSVIAWGLSPRVGGPATMHWFGWQVRYPIEPGSVTALQYAQRLYQFPLGVFGVALATAIFPCLARAAATRDGSGSGVDDRDRPGEAPAAGDTSWQPRFGQMVQHGLRLTVFVGLPASVGLILIRLPLVRVIFERNEFTLNDSLRVATILAGYASAVWAYSMTHVLTRAFHAMKDPRTPLVVSGTMVGVNLALNLTLVWSLGAAALAWSTALCAVGQVAMLLAALGRRVDRPLDRCVWSAWGKSVLLTVIMTAALSPIVGFYDPADLSGHAARVQLLVMLVVGVVIVLAGARLLGAEELQWLFRRRATGLRSQEPSGRP